MKEFLLSDETRNSYGLIIKTDGIKLDRFLRNPVMFLNHDRQLGIAGRWENIRRNARTGKNGKGTMRNRIFKRCEYRHR